MMYFLVLLLVQGDQVQQHTESIHTLERCVEKAEYYRAKYPVLIQGIQCNKQ